MFTCVYPDLFFMRLPHDVLADIFLHPDSHSVEQKYRLSQVCSFWRRTALGLPLLWARVTVATPLDVARLSTVLERSKSVALDIQLPWYYRHYAHRYRTDLPLSDEARSTVVAALVPQRGRIRRMHVIYTRSTAIALRHMLWDDLVFPMLQDLELHGSWITEPHMPALQPLQLSAPKLLRLYLSSVKIDDWESILPPSLAHVHIINCSSAADARLIPTIFQRCSQLRQLRLTLHKYRCADGLLPSGLTIDVAQLVPSLRSLDLWVGPSDCAAVLRSCAALHEIAAGVESGIVDDKAKLLIAQLCRGVGPLVELHVPSDRDIVLRDGAGRTRRLQIGSDTHWRWPDVWAALATSHSAHASVAVVRLRTTDWNDVAGAFDAVPPEAPDVALHVHLHSERVNRELWDRPSPRRLTLPNLRLIKFHDHDDFRGSRAEIIHKLLGLVHCASPRVEVCVAGAGLDKGNSDTEGSVTTFRDKLVNGKWTLCGHCADAA